jgi:hypothetical protein
MATNTGKDFRRGSVDSRAQIQNPRTGIWTKRNTNTGQFIKGKEDRQPFKGVAKEIDHRRERD